MLIHRRPGSCLIFLMLLHTLRGRTFPESVFTAPSSSPKLYLKARAHTVSFCYYLALFFSPLTPSFCYCFTLFFFSFKNVMLLSEESSIAICIVMATGLPPLPKAHPQAHCAHYQTGRQHPAYRWTSQHGLLSLQLDWHSSCYGAMAVPEKGKESS